MLEMHIDDAYMYTTYESVHLSLSETMPTARRLPLGGKLIKPQEEWEGSNFGLNFGVRIKFVHRPIQMERLTKNFGTAIRLKQMHITFRVRTP